MHVQRVHGARSEVVSPQRRHVERGRVGTAGCRQGSDVDFAKVGFCNRVGIKTFFLKTSSYQHTVALWTLIFAGIGKGSLNGEICNAFIVSGIRRSQKVSRVLGGIEVRRRQYSLLVVSVVRSSPLVNGSRQGHLVEEERQEGNVFAWTCQWHLSACWRRRGRSENLNSHSS